MTPSFPYQLELEIILLAAPLLSAVLCRLVPGGTSPFIPIIAGSLLFIGTIASLTALLQQWNAAFQWEVAWFTVGDRSITAGFLINNVSLLMAAVISVISFSVHLFSYRYMAGEARTRSYYSNLGLFTFSMLGIVLSSSLVTLFIFWELVGYSSFLLISYYSHRPSAAVAATKAFLMNRIGDAAFLTGIILVWAQSGTWNLPELEQSGVTVGTGVGLLLFCGVISKSAQFPLFGWLPDAMEAPTPVSALIHAATMVAAGVFFLVRVNFLFTETLLLIIAVTGLVTALLGAIGALFHEDIKRILAYSTISQLGLMVMAIGAGAWSASFAHLVTHAFFKALMFLAAGSLAYAWRQDQAETNGAQDFRKMSRKGMSFTTTVFIVGGASMIGLPLTGGFLSKESILEGIQHPIFQLATVLISILTVMYTVRLILGLFLFKAGGESKKDTSPLSMGVAMAILAAGCSWFTVSLSPFQLSGWMLSGIGSVPELGFGMWSFVSLLMILISLVISVLWFRKRSVPLNKVILNNFGVDNLYTAVIVRPLLATASGAGWFDKVVIDGILHQVVYIKVTAALVTSWLDREVVDGVTTLLSKSILAGGSLFRSLVSGKIQQYILWAFAWLVIFMAWLLL